MKSTIWGLLLMSLFGCHSRQAELKNILMKNDWMGFYNQRYSVVQFKPDNQLVWSEARGSSVDWKAVFDEYKGKWHIEGDSLVVQMDTTTNWAFLDTRYLPKLGLKSLDLSERHFKGNAVLLPLRGKSYKLTSAHLQGKDFDYTDSHQRYNKIDSVEAYFIDSVQVLHSMVDGRRKQVTKSLYLDYWQFLSYQNHHFLITGTYPSTLRLFRVLATNSREIMCESIAPIIKDSTELSSPQNIILDTTHFTLKARMLPKQLAKTRKTLVGNWQRQNKGTSSLRTLSDLELDDYEDRYSSPDSLPFFRNELLVLNNDSTFLIAKYYTRTRGRWKFAPGGKQIILTYYRQHNIGAKKAQTEYTRVGYLNASGVVAFTPGLQSYSSFLFGQKPLSVYKKINTDE